MSYFEDLPESCRYRLDMKKPAVITGSNIGRAGQSAGESETWTKVPDADIEDFLQVVFGLPEVVGGINAAAVRVVPLRHFRFPWLLADAFTAEAFGGVIDGPAGQPNRREYYRVTVNFSTPPFGLDGDKAFLTESVQNSSRQIPAPAAAYRVGGAAPVFDPGREIPGQLLTLTVHNLETLPVSTYQAYTGYTNGSVFLNCPIGTVLYRGPSGERTSQFGSTTSYTVGHVFDISEVPWNYAYQPDGVLAMKYRADGVTLDHPYADFTQLFG